MKNLSLKNLTFWFNHKKTLFNYFKKYQVGKGQTRRLFWDNGAKVLLVSHIDTVHNPKINRITKKKVYAAGLDDRLGCALSYHIMQFVHVDLLICDYEERGSSTAAYHKLKDYNFIIELDRSGIDFVVYNNLAENQFIEDFANFTGRKLGFGSYSDICSMDSKIGRINVGIGYYHDHDKKSFAIRKEITKASKDVIGFIKKYGSTKYEAGLETSYDRGSMYDLPFENAEWGWQSYSKFYNPTWSDPAGNPADNYDIETWVCVHCNTTIEQNPFDPPMCCGEYMKPYSECYKL